MAVILGILQGVHKTNGIFTFPFLDGLEKLVCQVGEIFSFADPDLIRLGMKLGRKASKLVDDLFLGNLPVLGDFKNTLEGVVKSGF